MAPWNGPNNSRSAVSGALVVPWTSTGQRSFAVYGTDYRQPSELSLSSFNRQLKTHMSLPALVCLLQLCVSYTYRRPALL